MGAGTAIWPPRGAFEGAENGKGNRTGGFRKFQGIEKWRTWQPPSRSGEGSSYSRHPVLPPPDQKSNSPYAKETMTALLPVGLEQEVIDADLLLPAILPFKRMQMSEKYPKGHARGRHWKHLKQILQAENYHLCPADEPNYVNIESAPSMYPAKKYCDITGFEAPYTDPRTKLRFASVDVFKRIRSLSDEHIQGYLALRNAAIVLK